MCGVSYLSLGDLCGVVAVVVGTYTGVFFPCVAVEKKKENAGGTQKKKIGNLTSDVLQIP